MEKIVKLFGGDIMTISNPMYPLKFEHFGEADLAEDPEFKSKLDSLYVMGSPVSCEMLAMPNAYASKRIYKAEEKARQCYVADDPVKGAKEALSISPYCPEAYNVMALFGADSYSEALGRFCHVCCCVNCLQPVGVTKAVYQTMTYTVFRLFNIKSIFVFV
jgi:hypothetical protein